jgi:hypothetical protein
LSEYIYEIIADIRELQIIPDLLEKHDGLKGSSIGNSVPLMDEKL